MKTLKEKILDAIEPDLAAIEGELTANLEPHVPLVSHVAKYILFSGGKRIRPVLMVLSARLCGYEGSFDKTLSVVFEYLHAATLLHDDLVDGAEVRRGNPVAYSIWGNPATVLVGDFLLARSMSIATKTGIMPIVETITQTTADMSEGEIHQLVHRGNPGLSESEYMEVIRRKTACLIQAACRVGALLAGASQDKVDALTQYGQDLGCAFQLLDDLLDYIADAEVLGKATGTDLKEGKMTLPLIHAVSQASDNDRQQIDRIIRSEAETEGDFETILQLVKKYGGIPYTKEKAKALVDRAKVCLEAFESSSTRCLLENLADYVLMRDK
jgi:octaprenyl-diphosphate synthase